MGIPIGLLGRRAFAMAIGISLLTGVAAAPPPAAAADLPVNVVTLTGTATARHVGQDVGFTASATGATATIELWDAVDGGTAAKVAEQPAVPGGGAYTASFTVASLALGSHAFTARSVASDTFAPGTSAPWTVAVTKMPTEIALTLSGTPLGGVPIDAVVELTQTDPASPATGATGSVSVKEGTTVLGSCVLASGSCHVVLTLAAGAHTLTVAYPGDGAFAAATADNVQNVAANTVDATGVGLSLATFYPYKDGYRDAVVARGTRNEPISVLIKVKSPTGRTLKSQTVALGTGAYSYSWYGRNASGTMYPAGKYTIEQTLSDGTTSTTWKSVVNLSAKRLYTYKKTLTKDYAHRSAQAANSVAWQFTLPRATVYKKLVFAVYAKSSPAGAFGPHDFSSCGKATWALDCANPGKYIGSSMAWRSLAGSVKYNRSGTYVRLYAVAKVRSNLKFGRVTVTYAVLR